MNNIILILFIIFTKSFCEMVNNQGLSEQRANMGSASLIEQGIAMFAGGNDIISGKDRVDIFDSNLNVWSTAVLSVARSFLSGTSLTKYGLIFMAGGCKYSYFTESDESYSNVDIYNHNTKNWTVDHLSQARYSLTATSLDESGLVFFAGGKNNYKDISSLIDIYDAQNKKWSTAELSNSRYNLATTTVQFFGQSYFAGGTYKNYASSDIVDIYNYNSNNWTSFKLKFARTNFAATSLEEGYIFFGGGRDSYDRDLDTLEIYYLTKFLYIFYLNKPRRTLVASTIPSQKIVYFAGGVQYSNGNVAHYSNIVDFLDFNSQSKSFFTLNTPAGFSAIASLPNQNLVIYAGGMNNMNDGFLNNVEMFGSCLRGFYQTINPNICDACPEGFLCRFGDTVPLTCPPGYYCPSGGLGAFPCPPGTYTNLFGGLKSEKECSRCPAGYFNPFFSKYGSNFMEVCAYCNDGTYCPEGSPIPRSCPANHYCPKPSNLIKCKEGTYRPEYSPHFTKCDECPVGFYCPEGVGNLPCPPGYYTSKNGSSSCDPCLAGYFCPYQTENPSICMKDTFAIKGQSVCTPCQEGTFTKYDGASECSPCLISFWTIDNWGCQTIYEKLISVAIWVGSFFSIGFTVFKGYRIIRKRAKKLRLAEMPITLKNMVFIESRLKRGTYYLNLISQMDDPKNEFLCRKSYDEELQGLRETIINLKMEIEDLKYYKKLK